MLPYTPLHHLLLEATGHYGIKALVMTSGNTSEEPLVCDNQKARQQLGHIAELFLTHDRDIHSRCDDSVIRVLDNRPLMIRRARGYGPQPLVVGSKLPQILACGPELKNTFCLTRDHYAFLSQHIGDLKNWETLEYFEQAIEHFCRLFRIRPQLVAYDLHPDYLATQFAERFAREHGLPSIGVQHHHAHVVSCMAENGLSGRVIGIALDGTGYGEDGTIWGGEILVASPSRFTRLTHLMKLPLPGGDRAVREPFRMTISFLHHLWGPDFPKKKLTLVKRLTELTGGRKKLSTLLAMLTRQVNCPLTSSCGRFFDAVSALLGVCERSNYEGQAAAELEMCAFREFQNSQPRYMSMLAQKAPYPLVAKQARPWVIATPEMFREMLELYLAGADAPQVAMTFHLRLVQALAQACLKIRAQTGLERVVLSGGCFQNVLLTRLLTRLLDRLGFRCYTHSLVPPNDGGVALGQALVAAAHLAGR
jgi:hydrogenase maturation protein HypF